jgi:hypothetical protein
MVRSVARKKESLRILFWLVPCALLFTAAPSPAAAQFKAWVMAKLPDTPEGLGVDSHGNLYATLMHIGEVVIVKDDGSYDHERMGMPRRCPMLRLSSALRNCQPVGRWRGGRSCRTS